MTKLLVRRLLRLGQWLTSRLGIACGRLVGEMRASAIEIVHGDTGICPLGGPFDLVKRTSAAAVQLEAWKIALVHVNTWYRILVVLDSDTTAGKPGDEPLFARCETMPVVKYCRRLRRPIAGEVGAYEYNAARFAESRGCG